MEDVQTNRELQQVIRYILRKSVVYGKNVDLRFSGSQVGAMEVIQTQGPINVSHLAESLSLSLSAVTLLCDRLIQNGYVKRERDDEDRRVVYLEITEQGREELAAILSKEKELVCIWLEGLTDEELQQFNKTFQYILENVRSTKVKNKADKLKCC
jgi:DNA-binding MarR family transcriptional regulator